MSVFTFSTDHKSLQDSFITLVYVECVCGGGGWAWAWDKQGLLGKVKGRILTQYGQEFIMYRYIVHVYIG